MPIGSATNFGAMTTRRVQSGCGRSWPATWPMRCGPRDGQSAKSPEGLRCRRNWIPRRTASAPGWSPSNRRPVEQAMRHELAVQLANALARLPHSQREALLLHYWQGCSLAEDRSATQSDHGRRWVDSSNAACIISASYSTPEIE